MEDRDNRNLLKCWSVLFYAKQGLKDFVENKLKELQNNIVSGIGEELCTTCSTPNVLSCPTAGVCETADGQCRYHRVPLDSIFFSWISVMAFSSPQSIPNWNLPKPCKFHTAFSNRLVQQHNYRESSTLWKSEAEKWATDTSEMAKCFSNDRATTSEIDLVELCNVMMNCKRFQQFMKADLLQPFSICAKVCLLNNLFNINI